jgi:hypothetical protein
MTHPTMTADSAEAERSRGPSEFLTWGPLVHALVVVATTDLALLRDVPWPVPLEVALVLFWIWPVWTIAVISMRRSLRNVLAMSVAGIMIALTAPTMVTFTTWLRHEFV